MNPNDQLNASVAKLNTALAGLNKAKGTNFKALAPVNTTIQADKLGTTSNFKISPTSPALGIDGELASIGNNANTFQDEFTRMQAEQTKTASTAKTSSLKSYVDRLMGSKGKAELENEAFKSVDPIEKELKDINQQILNEQVGLQRKIEEIEKNPRGMTSFGLQDEIDRAKTASYRRQADASLVQMAVQGKYDSAVAQANRTVDILLEKEQKALEASRLVYEENKDLFTLAEQRQYETMQADRERALNMQADEMKSVKELALNAQRNGAPTALVQQALGANTQAEALALVGGYVDRLDRQLQLAQIGSANRANQPDSFDYQGTDAPLYSGLNSATATAVRQQVGAFKSEPVVTNFSVIQEGRDFAKSISTNTQNPADDQALIYSLAKALDPGSVVREGEYATAQKYAQSWVNAYGSSINQAVAGTGFLSKTARENIKNTIETKYQSSKKSYDNLYNQYTKGVDSLTGRKDGSEFLRDYRIQEKTATQQLDEELNTSSPLLIPDAYQEPTGFLNSFLGAFGLSKKK